MDGKKLIEEEMSNGEEDDWDFNKSEEKENLIPFYERNHIGFVASKLNFRNMANQLNNLENEEDKDAKYESNRKKLEGKRVFDPEGAFLKYWNILNSLIIVKHILKIF